MGWLEPRLTQARMFHSGSALAGRLELKWAQARISRGAPHSEYPGRVAGAGAKASMSQEVAECSVPGGPQHAIWS